MLLRVSVATALIAEDYSRRHELAGWILGTAILLSAALLIGYFTPIAAGLTVLFHALVWYGLSGSTAAALAVACLDSLALAMLGPGAYSLDSYRFGRRVVVLPPPP